VAACDVCIVPHLRDDLTGTMDPLKLYEYLAAGRPVVSSPMEETRTIPGVWTAATRIEWRQALSEALAASKDEGFRARIRGFARENDWSARARQALAHLVY